MIIRALKGKWASIPFLLFALATILRPDLGLDGGWLIRCWALFAFSAFGILLFPLFFSQGTWNFYLAMLTHALIYVLCLFGTWAAGVSSDVQIGGIFPFNDAAGYFQDAILLTA